MNEHNDTKLNAAISTHKEAMAALRKNVDQWNEFEGMRASFHPDPVPPYIQKWIDRAEYDVRQAFPRAYQTSYALAEAAEAAGLEDRKIAETLQEATQDKVSYSVIQGVVKTLTGALGWPPARIVAAIRNLQGMTPEGIAEVLGTEDGICRYNVVAVVTALRDGLGLPTDAAIAAVSRGIRSVPNEAELARIHKTPPQDLQAIDPSLKGDPVINEDSYAAG
jgi:hypothetical protein